ncbi:HET-domain-containing protein, partial [Lophiostoma macrostomum CBS 122681]
RRWLHDCLSNHDHGVNAKASRAARLIDVRTEDGTQPIHLVDGSTIEHSFLALSHCWGDSATLRTTRATLEPFQTSIQWGQLPKTFQDAVQITRGLGVDYLWIDSLCIVQDDPGDWATESAKMAAIYNSALVTVMAASASDSQGGCFRSRPSEEDSIRVPYSDNTGTTSLGIHVSLPRPGYHKVVSNFPLFKRAWVVQEDLLLRRRLIFSDNQVYWDCSGSILAKSTIQQRSQEMDKSLRVFADPRLQGLNHDSKYWHSLWHGLVSKYSICSLTFDTDRLPSLSGLAQTFAQMSGHTYAAGL